MSVDLDTFLVALYTITDDLYQTHFAHRRRHPGCRGEMSDSEVLTLCLCAQWLHCSERALVRHAVAHWRGYFPRLLSQSAYNRRERGLAVVLASLVSHVAQEMHAFLASAQVVDTTAVPLMRRCRGRRRRLFGAEVTIGRGGSDHDWYYGCKLLVATAATGVITGFLLAPANTEDRWVAEAFWCWRADPHAQPVTPRDLPPSHRRGGRYVGPTGPLWPQQGVGNPFSGPYFVDRGFRGAWWMEHWQQAYGATVVPPTASTTHQHASLRQIVETVNGHLATVFNLPFPGARSCQGLLARVAAKLASFNLGIWLNRLFGRSPLAHATLFSW